MRRFAFLMLTGLLALTGCVNQRYTRMPTLAAADPRSERANYRYFDPYPERDLGPLPQGSGRPRGFDISRTEPRRAQEQSMGATDGNVIPTTSWDYERVGKYRDVVRP